MAGVSLGRYAGRGDDLVFLGLVTVIGHCEHVW